MRKRLLPCTLVLLFTLLSVGLLRAQGLERGEGISANASQIYFELGGPGIIYSFNYDGRFGKFENGIGFRIGIGGASINGNGYVAVPVQLNYLAGTKGKYLELGAGATYAPNLDLFNTTNSDGTTAVPQTYGTFTIGFRKQPLGRKGFTFRAAFTPIFSFAGRGSFLPFAGISWGYRF